MNISRWQCSNLSIINLKERVINNLKLKPRLHDDFNPDRNPDYVNPDYV